MVSVGTILVDKYQKMETPTKIPASKVSKRIINGFESTAWWTWMKDETRTRMIKTGGRTWVRGGELVNPLWFMGSVYFIYYRLQQSKVLSSVFPLISN